VADSIEQALFTELANSTGFTSNFNGFYYLHAPTTASMPYCTMFQVDDPNDKDLLSTYGGQARMQFSVWSRSKWDGTKRKAIKDELRSIRGTTQGLTVNNIVIANEVTLEGNEEEVFQFVVDAIVNWQE